MSIGSTAEASPRHTSRNWSALAAIVASLIGLMALVVSGYTAYVQRQQVRAQVWPYLMIGYADIERARIVFNRVSVPRSFAACRFSSTASPSRTGRT
jgi:hypothetical protein